MLQAGFAATGITPPLGKPIPGLFEPRLAEGIHDDLFARAAVIEDGERCVALVQVDAIAVTRGVVAAARKMAQRLCGIRARDCLIAATHTHSGGPAVGCFSSPGDAEYETFLAAQIASAIAEARRRGKLVHAAAGRGAAEGIAFNRRFVMRDGTHRTHPGKGNPDIVTPAGPEDPAVTVVAFRAPDAAEPLGCVVHFACHATHMNGVRYSADYPAWIVDTLRRFYGPAFGVVFLNGACGDVTQVDNRSLRPPEFGAAWARRTGVGVGAEALKTLERLDTYSDASIDALSSRARLPIRAISADAISAARALLMRGSPSPRGGGVFDAALFRKGVRGKGRMASSREVDALFAHELLAVAERRRVSPIVSAEVQGIRIKDLFIWGVPGELFQAFARYVEERLPFPSVCCVELANGFVGYICTPEALAKGGYEGRTARSSQLDETAGARVAAQALSLGRKLYARMPTGGAAAKE